MTDLPALTLGRRREAMLAAWARAFLFGYIALDAFSVLSMSVDWPLVQGSLVEFGELLGFIMAILFVGSPIAFLMWFYRAYANLSLATLLPATLSARAATIDWFIPIANLIRVPRHMATLLRISAFPNTSSDVESGRLPPLVGWWWYLGIGAYLLDRIGDYLLDTGGSAGSAVTGIQLIIIASLGNLAAGALAIVLVGRVHQGQQRLLGAAANGATVTAGMP